MRKNYAGRPVKNGGGDGEGMPSGPVIGTGLEMFEWYNGQLLVFRVEVGYLARPPVVLMAVCPREHRYEVICSG